MGSINWGSLGTVFVVSFGSAVVVVVLTTLAMVGVSARVTHSTEDGRPPMFSASTGTAVAGVCLLAVALIVLYGLYVIVA